MSMRKRQKFTTSVLGQLSKKEAEIIIELNSFIKKGRFHAHCNVFQRRETQDFTRRYLIVWALVQKGILKFNDGMRMNIRSYGFTKEFRKWQSK